MGQLLLCLLIAGGAAAVYWFVIRPRQQQNNPTPPAPQQGQWQIEYSQNEPAFMTQNPDGTFYFDFPVGVDGVHYVVEKAPPLAQGMTITMEYNVSGSANEVSVQGGTPAWVSLYIQRQGDDLSGAGPMQQYRYFHVGELLSSGDHVITVALDPALWGDVFGAKGSDFPTQFAACLANAAVIGFVFGDPGLGATGHGAYASAAARFTLKAFTVG